jgi:hypothetical protein
MIYSIYPEYGHFVIQSLEHGITTFGRTRERAIANLKWAIEQQELNKKLGPPCCRIVTQDDIDFIESL